MFTLFSSPFRRHTLLCILAMLFLTNGCMDWNKTLTAPKGGATTVTNCFTFQERLSSFPKISEWYDNKPGTVLASHDGYTWCVSWEVDLDSFEDIHVGFAFDNDKHFDDGGRDWDLKTTRSKAPKSVRLSSLNLKTRMDAKRDWVLEVSVLKSGPAALTLTQLDWTASKTRIPLDNLIFGDRLMNSLPWRKGPLKLPVVLKPGAPPLIIDIPDKEVSGYSFGLVRYITTEDIHKTRQETVVQSSLAK